MATDRMAAARAAKAAKAAARKSVEQVITEATGTATAVAEDVAAERRAKDAERKRQARAAERIEGKPRKRYPKADEFKGHPLAIALNEFADKAAGLSGTGSAAECQLGEAWMAVADHYMGDVVGHPLALATVATGQFAALAWALNVQKKNGAKGPGSPSGTNAPQQEVATPMDAPCVHCAKVFPDVPLLLAHVAEDHKDVAA